MLLLLGRVEMLRVREGLAKGHRIGSLVGGWGVRGHGLKMKLIDKVRGLALRRVPVPF